MNSGNVDIEMRKEKLPINEGIGYFRIKCIYQENKVNIVKKFGFRKTREQAYNEIVATRNKFLQNN